MKPTTIHRQLSQRSTLLALLGYGLLAILMTWPAITRLSSEIMGGRDDLWVHQWTFWWVKEALLSGQNPFFTTLLYFPNGVPLTSHNIAWFNIALWLPLQFIVGTIAAYNLSILLIYTLNGFCTYLFARAVLRLESAAFIAGLIVAFWPYTLSHFDHPNMIVLFWVPLTLLFIKRTLAEPTWLNGLLTAVFLAMIGISRWQLLLMSSPLLIGYTLYLLGTDSRTRSRQAISKLVVAGIIALLLMIPLAAPLVADQFTSDSPEDAFIIEPEMGRTDLAAYITPSLRQPLWGEIVAPRYKNLAANQFYVPFLGFTVLLLALIGAAGQWRQTWIWLLLAGFYVLLALGAELVINGRATGIPLPYTLVEDWIVFRIIRRPHRLNIFLSIPIAMLAGWGLVTLKGKLANKRTAYPAIAVTVSLLILLEYTPAPFPTTPLNLPAFYQQMAQEPDDFGVLDIPINDRSFDKWYMAYQTQHGKPLLTGHVSRMPDEAFAFLNSVPFLQYALQNDSQIDVNMSDVSHQLSLLAAKNVRYITLHKAFTNAGLISQWQDWLTVPPLYEDDELLVYATAPEVALSQSLEDSIGLIRASFSPETAVQGGTIKADIRWGSVEPVSANYKVCFNLTGQDGAIAQAHCQPVSEIWPTANWQANEIVREFYVLPVSPDIPPDSYEFTLSLTENEQAIGETAVLGNITIEPFAPEIETETRWERGIELPGYNAEKTADALNLSLFWHPIEPVDASFTVFVHIIDPETEQLVAQSDSIPRNWTYPTFAWEPGEIIRDNISIPIDLPAGHYEVWLGLYDGSGDRLPIELSDLPHTEDAVQIMTIEVPK